MKFASTEIFDELAYFGRNTMNEEILTLAEDFFVRCICKDENVKTFSQLRNIVYYKKSKEQDLKKLPTTLSSIVLHIKDA